MLNLLSIFFKKLWKDTGGAVTVTVVLQGTATSSMHIADVAATADADTTATIPHALGVVPLDVSLTPLLQVGASLSLWAASTIDATNVIGTKAITAGSGVAGDQVRFIISRPHSIIR